MTPLKKQFEQTNPQVNPNNLMQLALNFSRHSGMAPREDLRERPSVYARGESAPVGITHASLTHSFSRLFDAMRFKPAPPPRNTSTGAWAFGMLAYATPSFDFG